MNPKPFIRSYPALAGLLACLCATSMRAQTVPPPKTANLAPNTSAHLSVFTDSRGFGKDPFFPRSTRRNMTAAVNTNIVLSPGELPAGMSLKGLSGTKDRPLAIINNYTFAEGEEAEVRVIHQLFRVKVLEIKDRSVMVSVNGSSPRELTLRQGVQ